MKCNCGAKLNERTMYTKSLGCNVSSVKCPVCGLSHEVQAREGETHIQLVDRLQQEIKNK